MNWRDRNKILGPEWLEQGVDVWIDRDGFLAKRPAWANATTTTAANKRVLRVFSSWTGDIGTQSYMYASTDTGIWLIDNLTVSKLAGTAVTDGYWKFLNFNGKAYAFQKGQTPKVAATAGGNFADLTAAAGTIPTGDAFCAAFGRIWGATSDGQTLKYCALLDPTTWSGADAGQIDMHDVWGDADYITAIAQLGSALVVFGINHIVIWEDGAGSNIGIDPTQMAVVDIVRGTGCYFRDTVVQTGDGDLLFVSRNGLQSLNRTLQSKNNPVQTISKYVDNALRQGYATGAFPSPSTAQAAYDPVRGVYFLQFSTGAGYGVWVFQTRFMYQDEEGDVVCPAFFWSVSGCGAKCIAYDEYSQSIYAGLGSATSPTARVVKLTDNSATEYGFTGAVSIQPYIYSARLAPVQGRLVAGRGLRIAVKHAGTVNMYVGAIGSEDTPSGMTVIPQGTYWNLIRQLAAYTNSVGMSQDETLIPWGDPTVNTYYVDETDFETGGEGEWIQYVLQMYDPSLNGTGYELAITNVTAHFEIDRGT